MEDSNELVWQVQEALSRLRKIVGVFLAVTILILLMPEEFIRGDFTFRTYSPAIITELRLILEWAMREVPREGFFISVGSPIAIVLAYIELAVIDGIVVCVPFSIYQVYKFLEPGLYASEKKLVKFSFVLVIGLFVLGAIFGFLLMPVVMRSLVQIGSTLDYDLLVQYYDLGTVVEFMFWNVVATGLLFTYPIVILSMVLSGFVTSEDLKKRRRYVVTGLIGIAAIITPDPTPISMLLMSIPLTFIFELTINIAMKIERNSVYHELQTTKDGLIDRIKSKATL